MKKLQEETRKLIERFKKIEREKIGNEWTTEAMVLDLVEEVGELANAVMVDKKFKAKIREKSTVENSLCDILYAVIRIAEQYGIDLETSYLKTLKELNERLDKGEFVDEEP